MEVPREAGCTGTATPGVSGPLPRDSGRTHTAGSKNLVRYGGAPKCVLWAGGACRGYIVHH